MRISVVSWAAIKIILPWNFEWLWKLIWPKIPSIDGFLTYYPMSQCGLGTGSDIKYDFGSGVFETASD